MSAKTQVIQPKLLPEVFISADFVQFQYLRVRLPYSDNLVVAQN